MKKKPRFQIGDWVKVSGRVYFNYDGMRVRHIYMVPNEEDPGREFPMAGQITGARYRPMGQYYPESGSPASGFGFDDGHYEPAGFVVEGKSVFVWTVRMGMLNKEMECLDEQLALQVPVPSRSRWKHTVKWPDSARKAYSDAAKEAPRGERGRFRKLTADEGNTETHV